MDRVWQWTWDRHRAHYSWAVSAVAYGALLPVYLSYTLFIVVFEDSVHYLEAATTAAIAALVAVLVTVLPGTKAWRLVRLWVAGEQLDRLEVLQSTYAFARAAVVRGIAVIALGCGAAGVAVGAVVGAPTRRTIEYLIGGIALGAGAQLIAHHTFVEAFLRPARVVLASDSGLGDALPRSRPSYATWANLAILATAWIFTLSGAALGSVVHRTSEDPAFSLIIATGVTLVFAVPLVVGSGFSPSLQPIRDLAQGTKRVAAGDYSQRLPVVQDDDLGVLVASFNRMQAGLAERERLHAAFGSYVDPVLATRLLEQGDDTFTGERRDVTVVFVDIRDFTRFAEANTAEDTVFRLNALFDIVVPAVHDAGGHVNKYLGDGAMAVFGAPNDLAQHADAAVAAAARIRKQVAERFEGELRIGIGINTGQVIAGTIGGAGKLEFTLIGDTVNVAARVEQLTKATGDTILLTRHTLDSLTRPVGGLTDRGIHDLKGKAATVHVYALDATTAPPESAA